MSSVPAPRVALETSVRAASVALDWGDGIVTRQLESGRAHASDLLPALQELLAEGNLSPKDLELVVVGLGPGSYTGLRVGVATALGLAEGSGAQLVGVPSVEALAFGSLGPQETGAVVLDARGGELYFACFERNPDGLRTLQAPEAIRPEELEQRLPQQGLIFADANLAERAPLSETDPKRLRLDPKPEAGAVLELGLERLLAEGPSEPNQVRPLYLRPFGARKRRR